MRHFSLSLQNSEYPRIFQVMGANQNARKLLSTDLVNTKLFYSASLTNFIYQLSAEVLLVLQLHQSELVDILKMKLEQMKGKLEGLL